MIFIIFCSFGQLRCFVVNLVLPKMNHFFGVKFFPKFSLLKKYDVQKLCSNTREVVSFTQTKWTKPALALTFQLHLIANSWSRSGGMQRVYVLTQPFMAANMSVLGLILISSQNLRYAMGEETRFMCHVSAVMCQLSAVTVTCYMSHVTCIKKLTNWLSQSVKGLLSMGPSLPFFFLYITFDHDWIYKF